MKYLSRLPGPSWIYIALIILVVVMYMRKRKA